MKNTFGILVVLVLCLGFASCNGGSGSGGPSATGYWRTASTSSGYLWLRLVDTSGSISGSLGVSTQSGSLSLSGTRTGSNLSISYSSSGGSFEFTGPINGDTFTSLATICATTCSSGTIPFTRTSGAARVDATNDAQSVDVDGLLETAKTLLP